MKKMLLAVLTVIMLSALNVNNVSAKEKFVNNYGIEISSLEYNKFESMGYVEVEIMNLTLEKYNELISYEVMHTEQVKEYYVTNYEKVNGEIKEKEQKKVKKDEYYDSLELYNSTQTQSLRLDDMGEGSLLPFGESVSAQDQHGPNGYKVLTTTITYLSTTKVKVKVVVDWDTIPATREWDIISIATQSDYNITTEMIGTYQYPKFTANQYVEYFDEWNQSSGTFNYVYSNTSSGYYENQDEGLAVKMNLNNNDISCTTHWFWGTTCKYDVMVTDFVMTLEAEFYPQSYTFEPPYHNSVEASGTYIHARKTWSFDWSHVSVSFPLGISVSGPASGETYDTILLGRPVLCLDPNICQ